MDVLNAQTTDLGRRAVLAGAAGISGALAFGGVGFAGVAAAASENDGAAAVPPLRGRGVVYDTGFFQANVVPSTNEPWDPQLVKREMQVIRHELACNTVRVFGGDQDRLETAAILAAQAGLEVWYSPFTNDLDSAAMLEFLVDAAQRCERLRSRGHDVVLTTGSEVAFSMRGFIPGDTFLERVSFLTSNDPRRGIVFAQMPGKINAFFAQAVPAVRQHFNGPVTYASLSFERVDWTPFDIVSADYYPGMIDGVFPPVAAQQVQALAAYGKPVAITEFGCGAFRGAAAVAGGSSNAIEWDTVTNEGIRLNQDLVRDEGEQATYLTAALDLFAENGVDSAFVNNFATRNAKHRSDPHVDVDMAGFGLISQLEEPGNHYKDFQWEPKLSYEAVGRYFGRSRRIPGMPRVRG